jgi:hypothetical protein
MGPMEDNKTMEHPERSSYIFTLAEEAGIPLGPGEQDVLEDEAFLQFCKRYRTWAKSRDRALSVYLTRTPSLFRCYLPDSSRVFQAARQVLWYLDEIVVQDPITTRLPPSNREDQRNEDTKANLRRTLQLLNHFRQSIDSGYLLFAGSDLIPSLGGKPPAQVHELLRRPDLVLELDQAVRFGLDRQPDDQGREWVVYAAYLDSGHILGWYVEELRGTASSAIRVGEVLPASSASELSAILKRDIYDQVRPLYPREVHRTLHAIGVAVSLDAAILFDRQVDSAIISIAGNPAADPKRQALTVASINLMLPYLHGVPADRLLDLRSAVPEAFYEFRSRIADIVLTAMKEDPEKAPELARLAAERELLPHVRNLQLEMEAASRKARILGYGLPVVSAIGALVGKVAGVDTGTLIKLLIGGQAETIKAWTDFSEERRKVQKNPFYFLWRAKHG